MNAGDRVTHIAEHKKPCHERDHGQVLRMFERKEKKFVHQFATVKWDDGQTGKHPAANLFPCECHKAIELLEPTP